MMKTISKNIILLSLGQALTSTVVSLLTLVSSLSGNALAPIKSLSTLPVTSTVLGTLVMIYPASVLMGRMGRRQGFMIKAGIGIIGGIICYFAIVLQNFYALVFGTFILGIFNSFGQYYRFAALDVAKTEKEKHVAISVVTGGGVVGGILGPFLGGHYAGKISSTPYGGAFIILTIVCFFLAISQIWLSSDIGKNNIKSTKSDQKLNLNHIFISTTIICAIGFSIMTLVMNAAPISLHHHGFNLNDTALVLQIHFIFMYVPSFINPFIINKIEIKGLIYLGIIAALIGCSLAFLSEQSKLIYIFELGLSGVAWNFIFNGGTLLLVNTYHPKLKVKAQGFNSLVVYASNIIASFSAGLLITKYNWMAVNFVCFPLLFICTFLVYKRVKNKTT